MQNLVALGLMVRYREINKVFPLKVQVKLVTLRGGAKFDPSAIIWTLLVEAHYIGLNAKLGKPMPYC